MAATLMQPLQCRTWFARLDLEFRSRDSGTVLTGNRHTGPLRLQRPFYPEDGVCHACILHPPGGVVGGDRLELHTVVKSDAAALLTTPGATKFYRSGGDRASQANHFFVASNGWLEWLPQETIIYPGAEARSVTEINLEADAGFIGWEILCLGLPACGRPFQFGSMQTTFDIIRAGRLLLKDRLNVAGAEDIARPAGLRGYSVSATFAAAGCHPAMLEPLRQIVADHCDMLAGVTLLDELLVARCLSDSSSKVKELFKALWTWLRPHLSGRNASPPRIWET